MNPPAAIFQIKANILRITDVGYNRIGRPENVDLKTYATRHMPQMFIELRNILLTDIPQMNSGTARTIADGGVPRKPRGGLRSPGLFVEGWLLLAFGDAFGGTLCSSIARTTERICESHKATRLTFVKRDLV